MANDPHRDVLPVREYTENRSKDYDHSLIRKFKRPDLEDKYLRLYDENVNLKRLTNEQENKIKRLGSKLLRFINEKKNASSVAVSKHSDEFDELSLKILELQHENYSLKDKNTVLKQQLASHSRTHMAAHRSPVRLLRAHSSPRLTHRQQSVPNVRTEESASTSNQRPPSDLESPDTEVDIQAQDEEIKRLQSEVDALRKEIKMSALSINKNKLDENIELIKLRRINKQQEAQLRNMELKLKRVQVDLCRIQDENDDAMQMITEKQNEVIDLQSKLNDNLRYQQEWQEMKELVLDLTKERDCLFERCEALMKTISENVTSTITITSEKPSPALPREVESADQKVSSSKSQSPIENNIRATSVERTNCSTQTMGEEIAPAQSVDLMLLKSTELKDATVSFNAPKQSTYDVLRLLSAKNRSGADSDRTIVLPPVVEKIVEEEIPKVKSPIDSAILSAVGIDMSTTNESLVATTERVNLQRELDCLREMLRSQTMRCESQQQEIFRLQQETETNEIRYKDVFQQRDLFYRLLNQSNFRFDPSSTENKSLTKKSQSSDSESGGSSGGNTYTKKCSTYTISSPIAPSDDVVDVIGIAAKGSTENLIEPLKHEDESVKKEVRKTVPVAAPRKKVQTIFVDSIKDDKSIKLQVIPKINLTILWLTLEVDSRLIQEENITALYVDFTFLGHSSNEYETPNAMKKPLLLNEKCTFNYTSDIVWNDSTVSRLNDLKNSEVQNVIEFHIVNEPAGDASIVECAVVGTSAVSLEQFLHCYSDDELLLPIFDIAECNSIIGTLAVKLKIPPAIASSLN